MTFKSWLNKFIAEKGIDPEYIMEVEGPVWGMNLIPVQVLVDAICSAPRHEQAAIKKMIVRIDFLNGNVLDYFKHLAKAIAL